MAVDSRDTNGAPIFLSGEALDTAADLTTLGEEIYERGTRLIGTTADRTGYDYPVEGLGWYDTDLDREFVYDGDGWVDLGGLDTGYVQLTTFGSNWSATSGYTPWIRR